MALLSLGMPDSSSAAIGFNPPTTTMPTLSIPTAPRRAACSDSRSPARRRTRAMPYGSSTPGRLVADNRHLAETGKDPSVVLADRGNNIGHLGTDKEFERVHRGAIVADQGHKAGRLRITDLDKTAKPGGDRNPGLQKDAVDRHAADRADTRLAFGITISPSVLRSADHHMIAHDIGRGKNRLHDADGFVEPVIGNIRNVENDIAGLRLEIKCRQVRQRLDLADDKPDPACNVVCASSVRPRSVILRPSLPKTSVKPRASRMRRWLSHRTVAQIESVRFQFACDLP